jgi:[acyl-carrier-protein] S-malonyltransferase
MSRALIVCPGRGSYDRSSLGQLQDRSPEARAIIDACDAYRVANGRIPLTELDADKRYRTTRHVAGEHASLLTFCCSLADLADLSTRYEVVGVTGNSMGFYTALAASGALPLQEAIALVDTMGDYQVKNVVGGQLLFPITDKTWAVDPSLVDAVDEAIASARAAGHQAYWSIRLGGYAVLGADKAGVKHLLHALPKQERGTREFPVQLPLHSAFHTPLLEATSQRALQELRGLSFRAPRLPLVDGRGSVWRPNWSDPAKLLDYTLGHQVTQTFDFTTAVRTALRASGAQTVIALGPGNSLGGPLARILVSDGWGGVSTRADLDARQKSEPLLLSFGVSLQRRALV